MKALKKVVAMLIIMTLAFSGAAYAAVPTQAEIDESTEKGMEWLANQQNGDGSWGMSDKIARTGMALLKFETHALNDPELYGPFDEEYEYKDEVVAGLDYLFENAEVVDISVQPEGDPDTNDNDKGICFLHELHHETYATSIALMAIVANGAPDEEVDVIGSPVDGLTFKQVAQDMVDYLAFGQSDIDDDRGGWGYFANGFFAGNPGWSDNSNSGYATMGLSFAEHSDYNFMCTIPAFVKTELEIWIDYIQDVSGGSGYNTPPQMVNLLKTGNLLQQMAFVGIEITNSDVVAAIGYIQDHWEDMDQDPGWKGDSSSSNYQATFTLMKGLFGYGIETIDVGGPSFNWFGDIAEELLDEQNGDGSWPQCAWDTPDHVLSTTWALLTLQKVAPQFPEDVEIDIKPGSDPNAINLKNKGIVPVAILGSDVFDVMEVDTTTVRFSGVLGAEAEEKSIGYEDVNGDGFMDLVLHFKTQDTGIMPGDEEATIVGDLIGGFPFMGTDTIKTVPKE